MQIVRHISELPKTKQPIVLAMGCFDGVHTGHQKVISTAIEQAERQNGEAWVFTFNPHPAKILSPQTAPPLISAEPCRMRHFEHLGVAGVLVVPFTPDFAHLAPDTFISQLVQNMPTLRGIVCGTDWSFGYHASGHFQRLKKECSKHRITAMAVPPVLYHGEKISSTHIRTAIAEGDIPLAEKLLGRPFSIFGTVIQGQKIGRKLGFPTANIHPENELIPADGVYAAYTRIESPTSKVQRPPSESHPSTFDSRPLTLPIPSAVFIGARKTFDKKNRVIESYLLDFDGDLYGKAIEVSLVQKTRAVISFSSTEALIHQIKIDVSQIQTLLPRRIGTHYNSRIKLDFAGIDRVNE